MDEFWIISVHLRDTITSNVQFFAQNQINFADVADIEENSKIYSKKKSYGTVKIK